jgi:hypothetical protein
VLLYYYNINSNFKFNFNVNINTNRKEEEDFRYSLNKDNKAKCLNKLVKQFKEIRL